MKHCADFTDFSLYCTVKKTKNYTPAVQKAAIYLQTESLSWIIRVI